MSLRVAGHLYSGRTASAEDAIALCAETGSISFESSERMAVRLSEIRVSERLGDIPRTLLFPDGTMFETRDNDQIDEWLRQCGQRNSWRYRLERNSSIAGIALAVIALVVFVSVRWGIPAFSDYIAGRLPGEVDRIISTGAMEALDDGVFEATTLTEIEKEAIRTQFRKLVPAAAESAFEIEFRSGGWVGANAFALPDGTVVVTDELITVSKHADELGSVLLHEIGHVVHRHSLRQVIRHSWIAMLGLLVIGDVSSVGTLVLALPSVLVQSTYSREFETEADDYALIRMRELGLKPIHFANLMERIERCALQDDEFDECASDQEHGDDTQTGKPDGWLKYLSTHPTNSERLQRFKDPH